MRYLYYGFCFSSKYAPYIPNSELDSLMFLTKSGTITHQQIERIITLSEKILTDYPVSLYALRCQIYGLEQSGNHQKAEFRYRQYQMLIDALLSSGDGSSKQQPFYVIDPAHEYDVIIASHMEFKGIQYQIGANDFLEIMPNRKKLKGLYFNIDPCLVFLSKNTPTYYRDIATFLR